MTVSGWTMDSAERQSPQILERTTHNRRSDGVNLGRGFTERFRTLSWWRRATFSNSTAARERKAERKTVSRMGRMGIDTVLWGGE
jgi:hypothetical protein